MGKMYQVGELVVYGMHGVCRVVSEEERLVDKKRLNYLALEPLSNGNSRFLVPTQNAAAMAKLQPILSKEELEAMITSENVKTGEWIREENQRKQTYRELSRQRRPAKKSCAWYIRFTATRPTRAPLGERFTCATKIFSTTRRSF